MSIIQSVFDESLKSYTGNKAELLAVSDFTLKLKEELPGYFRNWLDPEFTGNPALKPIAKVEIEIDQLAYAYTVLFSEKGACMVTEGSAPDLYGWGLSDLFEEEPRLVSQFLALCFEKALPDACRASEFLTLPRSEEVVFSVGEHAGWVCEEVFVYKGGRHEIDHGNARLKILGQEAKRYIQGGTAEGVFEDHLKNINVRQCADEFMPVLKEFVYWLSEQNPEPLEDITIAWSSNFNKESGFGGCLDDKVYKWPGSFDFSKWFSRERPEDLDQDDMVKVRYCISLKIAEIACLASEELVELEVFQNLPKRDGFSMRIMNRTAGYSPKFYPFA